MGYAVHELSICDKEEAGIQWRIQRGLSSHGPLLKLAIEFGRPRRKSFVVSVLPLGRFLASIFSTLSCFLPFSLVPHTTILSETRSAYPIVSFPLVFFLSSDPLSPPSEGFRLRVHEPIQFFFLLQITSIRLISSCTISSTSSFVFMSLQLIFSIFLHTHISKASSLRISFFLCVHVSAA